MIKTSIKINRTIDTVWDYFTDTDNWVKWHGGSLKEVRPCWQSGASLIWSLGGASSIKKLTPKEEICVSGTWMDTSYMFHPSEEPTTIVEIIQSDPKGGAYFRDGGCANEASIEKTIQNLKTFIENETKETKFISSAEIKQYIEVLKNGNDEDKENAIKALGSLGSAANEAVPLIINAIKKDALCWSAIKALGDIGGKDAIQALCNALLTDTDAGVRMRAAGSLGRIGDPTAIPSLVKALEHPYEGVRATVIESLAILGDKTIESVIKKAVKDSSKFVSDAAKKALNKLNEKETNESFSGGKSWFSRLFGM